MQISKRTLRPFEAAHDAPGERPHERRQAIAAPSLNFPTHLCPMHLHGAVNPGLVSNLLRAVRRETGNGKRAIPAMTVAWGADPAPPLGRKRNGLPPQISPHFDRGHFHSVVPAVSCPSAFPLAPVLRVLDLPLGSPGAGGTMSGVFCRLAKIGMGCVSGKNDSLILCNIYLHTADFCVLLAPMNNTNSGTDHTSKPAPHAPCCRVSVVLSPREAELVRALCREYNIGPGRLFKLFIAIEARLGLLQREVTARLEAPLPPTRDAEH